MNSIPSPAQVRALLEPMNQAAIQNLAVRSGVPFTTLLKVRTGETANPRLETVRAIWPELIGAEGAPEVPAVAVQG